MSRLSALHAVVTGAAHPLGSATIRRLVAEGALVTATVKTDAEVTSLAGTFGPRVELRQLDVTSADGWEQLANGGRCTELGLHAVVHHAVVLRAGALVDIETVEMKTQLEVNLLAPALAMQALAPIMDRSGGGSIVAVAATAPAASDERASMFAATSWGLRGLIRAAALELGSQGIRVNAVCPSTDLISADHAGAHGRSVLADSGRQRDATEGDVAAMVAFLLSDDSASCTGGDFYVDAGSSARISPQA